LAHARLQRLSADRLVREDADEQAAFAAEVVRGGDSAGLDLAGADPRGLGRLQAVCAEGDGVPARGVAFHLSALAFAELDSFGHQGHRTPITFRSRVTSSNLNQSFTAVESPAAPPRVLRLR